MIINVMDENSNLNEQKWVFFGSIPIHTSFWFQGKYYTKKSSKAAVGDTFSRRYFPDYGAVLIDKHTFDTLGMTPDQEIPSQCQFVSIEPPSQADYEWGRKMVKERLGVD